MEHHFTVPVSVDVAWQALLDPERVAPCMPGATLNTVDGNDFTGSVKVKLGPVTLLYKGTGTFTEVDESALRVVVDASGKDSRGNGTAAATVTATLSEENGTTAVRVDTDLKITGKPAQLGRGLISEVGSKLIGQFASCLAERLAGADTTSAEQQPAAAASEAAAAPVDTASTASAEAGETTTSRSAPEPATSQAAAETTGDAAGEAAGETTGKTAGETAGETTGETVESRSTADSEESSAATTGQLPSDAVAGASSNGDRPAPRNPSSAGASERSSWRVTSPGTASGSGSSATPADAGTNGGNGVVAASSGARSDQAEAINLLDTAGTPVLKRIAPAVATAVVLFVLYRLLRRRRRG